MAKESMVSKQLCGYCRWDSRTNYGTYHNSRLRWNVSKHMCLLPWPKKKYGIISFTNLFSSYILKELFVGSHLMTVFFRSALIASWLQESESLFLSSPFLSLSLLGCGLFFFLWSRSNSYLSSIRWSFRGNDKRSSPLGSRTRYFALGWSWHKPLGSFVESIDGCTLCFVAWVGVAVSSSPLLDTRLRLEM